MPWMSCLPTAFLFLLLLPCFPAQDGGGNEQSTEVISAWEGDSVSVTCPMNGSQNQVGMRLTAIRENVNVIHMLKNETPNVNPDFANRTKYLKEGENLRITLQRLQESDSRVYVCSEMVKINGHHKDLYGKTTILVIKAKSSRGLEQSPLYANAGQGQSVSITCVLKSSPEDEGFYLLRTYMRPGTVLHVSKHNIKVSPAFGSRLQYSRVGNRTVITLQDLREDDSDNYVCAEEVTGSPLLSASGTMVLVKGAEQACEKSSWGFYILIVVVALLLCALVCFTLYHMDMKKYFQKKKKPNVVYEDMSYNSRRSTLVRTNTYSRDG